MLISNFLKVQSRYLGEWFDENDQGIRGLFDRTIPGTGE